MNIYAALYTYERPVVLKHCLNSILANGTRPDRLHIIDNASGPVVQEAIDNAVAHAPYITATRKSENKGAMDSGRIALNEARRRNPKYFFQLEGDYIFRPWAFETVVDVFENTLAGQACAGIVGYDHPNFYFPQIRDDVFPKGMIAQIGQDNVNRNILHRPFWSRRYMLEIVSNTCPTSFLNWHRVQEIAEEFPEFNRYLDKVMDPQPNPTYPDSAKYAKLRCIDDGMLSHCISFFWNKWAIKKGINRDRFGAWLNIKPSIANNITGGGQHTNLPEMATDGASPSWVE